MIKKIIHIFILFTLCSNIISCAGKSKEEKHKELPILEITDSQVKKTFDSIFKLQSTESYIDYSYFLYIKKDPESYFYLIQIYLCPTNLEIGDYFGLFYIDKSRVFVANGCNPNSIFKKTGDKQVIKYHTIEDKIPEEFQSWSFLYKQNYVRYLDMPIFLINRLNFKSCK